MYKEEYTLPVMELRNNQTDVGEACLPCILQASLLETLPTSINFQTSQPQLQAAGPTFSVTDLIKIVQLV